MATKIDLDDVQFAICLDSLGKPMSNQETEQSGLYAHVSRPPKQGQPTYEFLQKLETTANQSGLKFEMNHKKINLANEMLAWDHERFSLNKIPALTLSHFKSFKDTDRNTMTDTIQSVDEDILVKNIRHLVHSMARYIYKNDDISAHIQMEMTKEEEEHMMDLKVQDTDASRSPPSSPEKEDRDHVGNGRAFMPTVAITRTTG